MGDLILGIILQYMISASLAGGKELGDNDIFPAQRKQLKEAEYMC